MRARPFSGWIQVREIVLFFGGLVGLAVETGAWVFGQRTPDPSLLVVFTAMMGLPLVLRKDEK